MAYSSAVTGWTDSRMPRLVTIMSSRPGVSCKSTSGTTAGNLSTNSTSTMIQRGLSGSLLSSKYLLVGSNAVWSG